jgi:hypothetical protein
MTNDEREDFLTRFTSAWAARDGELFLNLWHPEGTPITPIADRPIHGRELGRLNEVQKQAAPDLVWQLLDWSSRGDIIIVEWQSSRFISGKRLDWRGVDKLRLKEGRIIEERVYADTAPLRAARTGSALEPILQL